MTKPTITAYDWVPPFAQGHVRDLRARWAFEEVGQPYDVRYLAQGEQKASPHRALQPFGQVPTYECEDLTLFESGAIVLHIAQTWPGLLPEDAAARMRATGWIFAAMNTLEPPIMDLPLVTIFEADKPWSAPRRPAVEARIRERLQELSNRLGERDWLEEDGFTAGDLMTASVLRNLEGEPLLAEYPNLAAYVTRATARPAFKKALADQLAGFTGKPPAGYEQWAEKLRAQGVDA